MATCDDIRTDLVAYVDGELDAAARVAVEGHVASCAACRRELALLRATGDLLAGLAAPAPAARFEERVRERLAKEAAREREGAREPIRLPAPGRLRRAFLAVAAAAAILAGGTTVYLTLSGRLGRDGRGTPGELPGEGGIARYGAGDEALEEEAIAKLDILENLDLVEDLELLESYEALEDPLQGLDLEGRG